MVMLGTAYAAVTLFTHRFPATTIPGLMITTSCETLTASNIPVGSSTGTIRFNCNGNPAFTRTSGPGSISPSFDLASTGYVGIYVIASTEPVCNFSNGFPRNTNSGPMFLSSGGLYPESTNTPAIVAVIPPNNYDYCVEFSSPSGSLSAFTATWSQ